MWKIIIRRRQREKKSNPENQTLTHTDTVTAMA